ncbi:SGNH/GDSL hydrolase family protein [Bacillus sp. SCS-153A]|uniref:SGNH/GDSL hydrolase family protein n=1 Tax=Rossellomorea sedimentorum TaxID=3115294 RepID=UPI003905AF44
MKKLSVFLLFSLCIGVIIYGNLHWKKIQSFTTPNVVESSEQGENSDLDNEVDTSLNQEDYMSFTGNWSEQLKSSYQEKLAKGEKLNIVIVGSQAMDAVDPGWNDLVAAAVSETFKETIELSSLSYGSHSLDFVLEDKAEEIAASKPDLVIFEPLTLNDNGKIRIEDSLDNIFTVVSEVSADHPDVEFILTPSQPLYQPVNYAAQIDALEQFAAENSFTYINHWDNWPDVDNEEVIDYLDEQSSPNELGQKAWADAIISYLISE